MASFGFGNEKQREAMSRMLGPGHVDHMVRQTIQACWMALPKDRQNIDEVERELKRLLDRAIRDLRDDATSFLRP